MTWGAHDFLSSRNSCPVCRGELSPPPPLWVRRLAPHRHLAFHLASRLACLPACLLASLQRHRHHLQRHQSSEGYNIQGSYREPF